MAQSTQDDDVKTAVQSGHLQTHSRSHATLLDLDRPNQQEARLPFGTSSSNSNPVRVGRDLVRTTPETQSKRRGARSASNKADKDIDLSIRATKGGKVKSSRKGPSKS